MGRGKLQMKKIENTTNRQVTFSKRRNGILKKAYELSTLCDVQIALLMFSPAGRLSYFSSQKRIEDLISCFVNLSVRERENALAPNCLDQKHFFGILQDKERVIRCLSLLRPVADSSEIEELREETSSLQQQLQLAEEHLRMFEPDVDFGPMTFMEELESCEKFLEDALGSVTNRKEQVLSNLVPVYHPNILKELVSSPAEEGQSSLRSEVLNWLK